MFLFVWTNSWMHVFELVVSSMGVLILGDWYGTGGWWKFILTEKWANQMSKSQNTYFHVTVTSKTG